MVKRLFNVTSFKKLAAMLIMTTCLSNCAATNQPNAIINDKQPQAHMAGQANSQRFQGDPTAIWAGLQRISSAELKKMLNDNHDPTQSAWIQLALISKRNNIDNQSLAHELINWRYENQRHPANQLLPTNQVLLQLQHTNPPKQIALLLPQSGPYSASGQIVREGFLHAYYNNHNQQKLGKQSIKFYDTSASVDIGSLYKQAVDEGADFVIGPLTKTEVQKLSALKSFHAPTLALNYTDAGFSSLPTNFYQYGLLPEDEASQLVERARAEGLEKAIVIAPQSPLGRRMVFAFNSRWQAAAGKIQDTWFYSNHTDFNQGIAGLMNIDINEDRKLMKEDNHKGILSEQRRQDFDVVFVFAQPQEARLIVPILRYYYAYNIPIFANADIYSGDPTKDVDVNGVTICEIPWKSRQTKQKNFNDASYDRLYAVGQDAYMLSQALNRLASLPYFSLYGGTGAMTLSANQQIHRRLPCRKIHHGLS